MKKLMDFFSKNTKIGQEQRKALHNRILAIRKEKTYIRNRNLRKYQDQLHVDFSKLIQKKLKNKNRLMILDVCSGEGIFLRDLKNIFKNKIETHSIDLKRTKEKIDKQHIGSIENYVFKQKFDIITSTFGLQYTQNFPLVFEKICNSLNANGTAIIQVTGNQHILVKKFKRKLKLKGIGVKQKGHRIIINKKSNIKINLQNEIIKELKTPKKFDFEKEGWLY